MCLLALELGDKQGLVEESLLAFFFGAMVKHY